MVPSHHSLVEGVETWADRTPGATAVIEDDRKVTYTQLRDRSRTVAGALAALGVEQGDRIGYVGRNSVEQIELTAGAGMLGAVVVPVNWRLSVRETHALIEHMDATVVVVQSELLGLARAALENADRVEDVIVIGGSATHGELGYDEWKASAAPLAPERFAVLQDTDVAAQLYTSGTSGIPKGVMLSCAGLRATVRLVAGVWKLDPGAVLLPALPWFHVGGIGAVAGALSAGISIVVQNEISGDHLLRAIERNRVTSTVVAPIMIQWLCAHPAARTTDLSSLRLVAYGGSPISSSVLHAVLDLLPQADLAQIYGLTEAWGTVTLLDGAAHHDSGHPERLQSAGRPVAGLTVRLVDPLTGEEAKRGEVGEIWVKYIGNMIGYYKQPELTAEVLTADGFLRTNDLGRLDEDGYLFLSDRVGDMIVSGGENIFPSELEEVIAGHPDVAEVAVVGVAHPTWGETPKAYVVPVEGTAPEPQQVIDYARQNLARYKCPTSVEMVAALPRNPSGKLLRRVLRDRAADAAGTTSD
ncbi:AMP-binding protein [Streptomyces sp. NPDC004542]|uniref:AMP-binding protein n=1 Tax=Streptomyces sp. NPDC004542 TaxID=3154281 RepID=UPI00339EC86A